MFRLICLCIGYCIGCIETAYVVGRIWQVDLRQHGSGNLGTTNISNMMETLKVDDDTPLESSMLPYASKVHRRRKRA